MKCFENPEIQVAVFKMEDVITTSYTDVNAGNSSANSGSGIATPFG